ncbi:DDE_3 domain-containing protein [Trichonephila clavipes]|nr:DDE_3 domain-containing protein [Trichonephila clavipes]
MPKKRTTAEKLTAELNQHLNSLESMIAVGNNLYKQNIYDRAAIPKSLVTNVNTKSVYSGVALTNLKTPSPEYDPDCRFPAVKSGIVSVIWAAVSWVSAGRIVTLKRRVTWEKYIEILVDLVHPKMQTLFPAGYRIFQHDNATIQATRHPIMV